MFQQLTLLHSINSEIQREKNLYHKLKLRQPQLLSGYLAYMNGYLYRVVRTEEGTDQLIIPSNWNGSKELIKELQEKRYISKALPILQNNLKVLNKFQKRFQLYDPQSIRTSLPSCYADFDITSLLLSGDICPEHWAAASYTKNTGYLKELKYQSEGGLLTRSKAEADIATKLEQNHLHFRYEPILYLGLHKAAPDFCVIHPTCRREIYWEHFGSMDDPKYANDTMEKLRLYAQYGYHLGDNLIMTWETKQNPLTFKHINERIETYFYS